MTQAGLNDNRIKMLLAGLETAHRALIKTGRLYDNAVEGEEQTKVLILSRHEFQGKNAEARSLEAATILQQSDAMHTDTELRKGLEWIMAQDKANLEIARERLSLHRALAYQVSGIASQGR